VPATNGTRDNTTLLSFILPPRATSGDDLAAVRPSVQHDEANSSMVIPGLFLNSSSEKRNEL